MSRHSHTTAAVVVVTAAALVVPSSSYAGASSTRPRTTTTTTNCTPDSGVITALQTALTTTRTTEGRGWRSTGWSTQMDDVWRWHVTSTVGFTKYGKVEYGTGTSTAMHISRTVTWYTEPDLVYLTIGADAVSRTAKGYLKRPAAGWTVTDYDRRWANSVIAGSYQSASPLTPESSSPADDLSSWLYRAAVSPCGYSRSDLPDGGQQITYQVSTVDEKTTATLTISPAGTLVRDQYSMNAYVPYVTDVTYSYASIPASSVRLPQPAYVVAQSRFDHAYFAANAKANLRSAASSVVNLVTYRIAASHTTTLSGKVGLIRWYAAQQLLTPTFTGVWRKGVGMNSQALMPLTSGTATRGATLKLRNPYTGVTRTVYIVVKTDGLIGYHF